MAKDVPNWNGLGATQLLLLFQMVSPSSRRPSQRCARKPPFLWEIEFHFLVLFE